MRTMSVEELKTHLSEALKSVEGGEKIAITNGSNNEIKALLVPNEANNKRKLGLLKGKADFKMAADFKMTEEEFIGI